jgi:1-acyl-sn-glycerol-3-phosphate acyltransferase
MSLSYDAAVRALRLLVGAFFRRVEVVGEENVPSEGGGLVVAWHPNGLVDPGLILTCFPRRIAFGARHGLFRVPVLGRLIHAVGAVPIYRAADQRRGSKRDRRAANQASLAELAGAISSGSFAALFPEGVSHDAPKLMELRTGAARLYYQARRATPAGAPTPVIMPVGLHYDDKRAFRSHALVEFHPPLVLPAALDVTPAEGAAESEERERAAELTRLIEEELTEVVHATESWELHHLMHRARKLMRAERAHRAAADPGRPDMQEKVLGFGRVWAGYQARLETHPEAVAHWRERLAHYDRALSALSMEDHELDLDPRLASPWLGLILLLQAATVYLVLPPILLVGFVVNLPVALALWVLSKAASRAYKDEATVKVLVGSVAFPVVWLAAGFAAYRAHEAFSNALPGLPNTPILAGVLVALLAFLGGAVSLRYLRVARETARAIRVRLFRRWRRNEVERLRRERAALFEGISALGSGLELPGHVGADGRVME